MRNDPETLQTADPNASTWANALPYALLIATTLIWGGNAVAGKAAVGVVPPATLVFVRWAIAVAILLPFAWPHLKRDWPVIRQHLWVLFAFGVCGFTLFNTLLYGALHFTTAINATLTQGAIPVFILLLNFLVFRTRISRLQALGVAISIFGVVLVASQGDPRLLLSLGINVGDGMMIIAALIYAA